MDELKYISWEYIVQNSVICASQDLEEPVIVSYEQIKDDIMSFIRFLVQSPKISLSVILKVLIFCFQNQL